MRPRIPVPALPILLLLLGCQQGSEERGARPAAVSPAYRQDVERLCDVLRLSGADQLPAGERMFTTATWLGDNLQTSEGRDFLVTFQQATDKAGALRAEAARVGLAGCPLADEWQR